MKLESERGKDAFSVNASDETRKRSQCSCSALKVSKWPGRRRESLIEKGEPGSECNCGEGQQNTQNAQMESCKVWWCVGAQACSVIKMSSVCWCWCGFWGRSFRFDRGRCNSFFLFYFFFLSRWLACRVKIYFCLSISNSFAIAKTKNEASLFPFVDVSEESCRRYCESRYTVYVVLARKILVQV